MREAKVPPLYVQCREQISLEDLAAVCAAAAAVILVVRDIGSRDWWRRRRLQQLA